MVQNIYWIIAIITISILLINAIYTFIMNVKCEKELKKFKKKQYEMLELQVKNIEKDKN